jgi:hypothetical protein
MHPLNNPSVIGNNFYTRPSSASTTYIEYIFNRLFHCVPVRLDFSDEFNTSCLEVIPQYFDVFTSLINKVDTHFLEENTWVGKPGTVFEQAIIGVGFKTHENNHSFPIVGYSNVYTQRNIDKDFLSKMFVSVKAVVRDREQAAAISELLDPHVLQKCSKMYVLSNTYGDLNLTALPVDKITPDIALNYGDDFVEVNNNILENLSKQKSGLYLFHGSPGTGKSTYIKYLCSGVLNRKIAYIPIGLISALTSPDMLPLLMEHKDLILVIEDAEQALIARDTASANSHVVSTILNLTDGFLGDAMNTSIVATFNTGKENIDEALLRKGRLRVCHEFKKLSIEQAKKLAEAIGQDASNVSEEMSLADIYYMAESSPEYGKKEDRRVGFC